MSLLRNTALFVALATSALAQDFSKCAGTTYETRICMSKIYQQSDADLNTTYRAALQKLGPYSDPKHHAANLRAAERRWISYRNAECKARYDLFEGGTGGPIENLACLIRITETRIAEIKQVYLSPH